jgi:hypothetical protein
MLVAQALNEKKGLSTIVERKGLSTIVATPFKKEDHTLGKNSYSRKSFLEIILS